MKLNADQLEILESYTKKEIEQELARWQDALAKKDEWDSLEEAEQQKLIDGVTG